MGAKIQCVKAREISSQRSVLSLEVTVVTDDGARGVATPESGVSTGKHEAAFLLDGGERYNGLGVRKAAENVNKVIGPALKGMDVTAQSEIDRLMVELDGTPNKSRLGANAAVGVSLALLKAAANSSRLPLYRYIGGAGACTMPIPIVGIGAGGRYRDPGRSRWFKPSYEFAAYGAGSYEDAVYWSWRCAEEVKRLLRERYPDRYAPGYHSSNLAGVIDHDRELLEIMAASIVRCGYEGKMGIYIDCAADCYYEKDIDGYVGLFSPGEKTRDELIAQLKDFVENYPIVSLEDPLHEEDFEGHAIATKELGIEVVGDDLFTTNVERLKQGISMGAANSMVLKITQVGTVSEALAACRVALTNGYNVHPCGSRGDRDSIGDFAVGLNAGQVRAGDHNRLLTIEEELGQSAVWPGKAAYKGWRQQTRPACLTAGLHNTMPGARHRGGERKESMMKVRAENGLARILKAEGVAWVSTFPVCCVNNALGQEGVPMLMMRDERYAVALADAFSRVTGGKQVGVCSVMGGLNPAGLQMAYGALAQAYDDSSPVLCITDGVPVGTGGSTNYDITRGFQAVTKWIGHIDQPQRVPEFMRRAFTHLRTGRPGPVLVTVPRYLGEYDEEEHPYVPVKGWKWTPDPDDVRAVVKALLAAKCPLLYVGEGVFYGDATEELRQFAELVQVPVLTTLKAKSAFPENHSLSVGVRGEPAAHFLHKCDLLFAIGSNLSRGHFHHVIPNAKDKVIVQCTVDTLDSNKSYQVDHALIGDSKLTLQALVDELASQTGGGVRANQELLGEIRAAKEQFMSRYRPLMESDEVPINPYRVYGDLMKTIDRDNSFVTHDSGNTRDQLSTVYEAVIPRGFMGWGNVSTLGFGLAAAVAGKLAYLERQCVNVTGDAGVGYMMGNFEALVRYNIGVTTIHINNGGFAGYGPGFWGPGHDPYTCEVCGHSVADMSEAARAIGYYAEDISEPSEIIPALRRAFDENAHGRPAYLEVICSQYPVFGAWVTAAG